MIKPNRLIWQRLRAPTKEQIGTVKTFEQFREAGLTFAGGFKGFQQKQQEQREAQQLAARQAAGLRKSGDPALPTPRPTQMIPAPTGAAPDAFDLAITDAKEPEPEPEVTLETTAVERARLIEQAKTAPAAERERINIQLRKLGEPSDIETAEAISREAISQAKAARVARAGRREEITVAPGEAGEIIRRGVSGVRAARAPGRAGAAVAGTQAQIIAEAEKAGERRLEEAIGVDPEMRRLSALEAGNVAKANQLLQAIRTTKFERAEEVQALQDQVLDFQVSLKEDAVSKALKTVDQLGGAVSQMPIDQFIDFASAQGLSAPTATALHQAATLEAEAAKTKDEREAEKLRLSAEKIRAEIEQIGIEEPTAAIQDFQFFQELQETNPALAERFANLKGFGKEEAARKAAETAKIVAQTGKINAELADSTGARAIDIGAVGTGEPLPILTLGQGTRADRHNNPVASKAYSQTINLLQNAGLIKGEDFDVGETTGGVDTDGVATVMFSDANAGVRGAIAILEGGQMGSWYANPAYAGGFTKILGKMSELTGENVTSLNAQDKFNAMPADQQIDVVNTIYRHEGGTQLFKKELGALDKFKARDLSVQVLGKRSGTKEENVAIVEDLFRQGFSTDEIQDKLRFAGQSSIVTGTIRNAAESIALGLSLGRQQVFLDSLDRRLEEGNVEDAKDFMQKIVIDSLPAEEARFTRGEIRTMDLFDEIQIDLEEYERKGGDTGIITGNIEAVANKLGRTTDPELREVAVKIGIALQRYRRAMTGVAFSPPEAEEYRKIFPSIDKVSEFNTATIQGAKEAMQNSLRSTFAITMGEQAYRDIFEGQALERAVNEQIIDPIGIGTPEDPLGILTSQS
jgi:hypothetical protein